MSPKISVILIETTHPGNIGSVARAMKTMGFHELVLVNPKIFPSDDAMALASGAGDVLDSARVVDSFEAAVEGCTWVVGTSARSRAIPWPASTPRVLAPQIIKQAGQGSVALVFGRESSGLTNEELAKCHHHVYIPANQDYSSLNLSQAVQIILYECQLALLDGLPVESLEPIEPLALQKDLEAFYAATEGLALKTGFLKPENPRYFMTRLRRIFAKNPLTIQELNMLRGLLASISLK